MKRLITTYVVNPEMLDEFVRASHEFATQTRNQDSHVLEFTIHKNSNTVTHYTSFTDQNAELLHKKAPRTQIFTKLVSSLCDAEPTEIELPEHGIKTGVHGTSYEEERKEQEEINLHLNQDEIENISKK